MLVDYLRPQKMNQSIPQRPKELLTMNVPESPFRAVSQTTLAENPSPASVHFEDSDPLKLSESTEEEDVGTSFRSGPKLAIPPFNPASCGWVRFESTPIASYFYHPERRIVIQQEPIKTQKKFPKEFGALFIGDPLPEGQEIYVYEAASVVVDHKAQTFGNPNSHKDQVNHQYWTFLHNFPCHHAYPPNAKRRAISILEMVAAQNLTQANNTTQDYDGSSTFFAFSQSEAKERIEFLKDSEEDSIPQRLVISNVMANYYRHCMTLRPGKSEDSNVASLSRIATFSNFLLAVGCFGMPPRYTERFELVHNVYLRRHRNEVWVSFLERVSGERVAANVMSGLILASSIAFYAIADLGVEAFFFINASLAFSLGSVLLGFNREPDENMSKIGAIPPGPKRTAADWVSESPPDPYDLITSTASTLDCQARILLLSVLCFLVAVLANIAINVYEAHKSGGSPIRYAFLSLSAFSLAVVTFLIFWQKKRRSQHNIV